MASRAITIRVDPEAAQACETASAEKKCKPDALLSLKLTEIARAERSLEDIMTEGGKSSRRRDTFGLELVTDEGSRQSGAGAFIKQLPVYQNVRS